VLDPPVVRFRCPYFQADVELTDERERHIAERHPDLLPAYRALLAATLANPDQIRISKRFTNARLFSKWYDELKGGKYIAIVVLSADDGSRHWVITAYMSRRLVSGDIEWARS
jgi:hypothetical protein